MRFNGLTSAWAEEATEMEQAASGAVGIRFEDTNEVIWAEPRPEDKDRLAELLRSGKTLVQLSGAAYDLEGHAQSADVTLDVEGHALTLRLPSASDAAELRRRLAITAAAATLVVAGGAVAMQAMNTPAQTQVAPAPGPAIVQPGVRTDASDIGIVDQAAQRAAEQFRAQQAAPVTQPGFQNPASDVGIMDQPATQAAEQSAGAGAAEDEGGIPKEGDQPEPR